MGSIYPRGTTLWIAYRDGNGARVCKSTGLRVGREREAQAVLDEVERLVGDGDEGAPAVRSAVAREPKVGRPVTRSITVQQYAERWIAARRDRIRTVGDEAGRLTHHVYPHIGDRAIDSIRPKDIRDLVLI